MKSLPESFRKAFFILSAVDFKKFSGVVGQVLAAVLLDTDNILHTKAGLGLGRAKEDIHAEGTFNSNSGFSAHVDMAEMMGSETYLYLVIDGTNFIARVKPDSTSQRNQEVTICMDPSKIHIFDKETGFMIHTMVSPLGFVGPGSEWRWGWAPTNGAWAIQGMYDYFLFTRDVEKLRKDFDI